MIETSLLDYELPDRLIAQEPLAERDGARLVVVDRSRNSITHSHVRDLAMHVPQSLVVLNDTRVMPARLWGKKPSGGRVELLLLERVGEPGSEERWRCFGRASKALRPGTSIAIDPRLDVRIERCDQPAEGAALHTVCFRAAPGTVVTDLLNKIGEVPLPPYIRRPAEERDRERYQTVYAREHGSVAAPTAGLHFSETLMASLGAARSEFARITLHVGPGTFAPIRAETLAEHTMHEERFTVPSAAAQAMTRARDARPRVPVLAVGTTVVRTLESVASEAGHVSARSGSTRIFIHPPYHFRAVDHLLTNFHFPRSTLLALVFAFGGVDLVRRAYREAIEREYRFFSYGDAMLLL